MLLVSPNMQFEQAFQRFYLDYVSNDPLNGEYYAPSLKNFSLYVARLHDESQGINLRFGYVPCSHFWFIDEMGEVVGVIRIRHNIEPEFLALEAGHIGYDIRPSKRGEGYGKQMLSLALPKARQLGLRDLLITANQDNIASRRVIEANGGQFENCIYGDVSQESIARYWIQLS